MNTCAGQLIGVLLMLAILIAGAGCAQAQSADSLGEYLRLFERDGFGPFLVWTASDSGDRHPHYEIFPTSKWQEATRRTVDEPGHAALIYEGCKLPGIEGDFDFEVHLRAAGDQSVDIETVIDNRLSIGLALARIVLRFPPSVVPAGPDSYLYYAFDDWVQDPVKNLTTTALMEEAPSTELGFRWDDGERGFYRQFQNGRPVLSIHKPGWGLVIHDLDPDNAAPGCLLAGSNDGALEIGYEYHLPGEMRPGNGIEGEMRLAPTLRATLLPGKREAATGWWEALEVYRQSAIESGLLDSTPLSQKVVPSRWAQESVFMVFNIGAGTDGMTPGTSTPATAVVKPWLDYLERAIQFYKRSGQRHFATMLWGWSAIGPYKPISGVDEILAGLKELASKYDVEIHPGIYVLPTYMGKAALGTPLEAAMLRDLRGNPHRWGPEDDLFTVDPGHPLFAAEIKRAIGEMMDKGVEWVYFDNPYFQLAQDLSQGGIVLEQGVASRKLIGEVKDLMEERGGGFICCERYRLGLESAYGVISDMALPNDENVPFTEALVHDLYTTGSFGDMIGISWQFMAADPEYGLGGTTPGAARLAHRLGVEGAAYGRTCIDGHLGAENGFFEAAGRPEPHFKLVGEVCEQSVLNGLRARLASEALRTGRMLPPPPSDGGKKRLARRQMLANGGWTPELRGWGERFPTGFFASQERPGWHTLAVANAEDKPARITFTFTPADYPTMTGYASWKLTGAAEGLSTLKAAETVKLIVDVPAHSVGLVDFEPVGR